MGRRELLDALHREGREKLAAIAGKVAAAEEQLRSAAEERLRELRQEHEVQCALLCGNHKRTLIAKAAHEASLIRLRAEHALSLRLYGRTRACLKQLRRDDAGQLFHALASELPAELCRMVWVSPADAGLAASHFPGATIIPDETVAGGVKAATADGSQAVDNTLETRLERAWPDLLPHLMAELREHPL